MMDNFENEPEVVSALTEGRKIHAIKILRASRGIGLKEAKDLVDEYMEAHGLSQDYQTLHVSPGVWILIVILALMAYYWFSRS